MAEAFGSTAAGIGIVIALAAIIGKAMTESGAADRVVRMFLAMLGEKHGAVAIASSGFAIAIPVFFDTVFYLLVPLCKSMYRRTGGHYVKYLLAAVSTASAHALVPPTPGPLLMADQLGVSIGMMMLVGLAVAVPATAAGLLFAVWCDRRMPHIVPPEETEPRVEVTAPDSAADLPPLGWAVAPIAVPVALITTSAVVKTAGVELPRSVASALEILGNPNFGAPAGGGHRAAHAAPLLRAHTQAYRQFGGTRPDEWRCGGTHYGRRRRVWGDAAGSRARARH